MSTEDSPVINGTPASVGLDHLLQAGRLAHHQIVDKDHREGFVTDEIAGTPDGVAKTERALLPRIGKITRFGQP